MIWLVGNKGMLGSEISRLLKYSSVPFAGTDLEVDISSLDALQSYAAGKKKEGKKIEWIINCAAYTAVDRAEDDVETCRRLNVEGAANIARCAKEINAKVLHFSTDYVFDGRGPEGEGGERPYLEDDKTNPIGVYGLSKRDGEDKILAACAEAYIVRTAWLYGAYGNNFVNSMLRLMNEKDEIRVVNDQRGSPTWARDLAMAVLAFIKAEDIGLDVPFGIYHYTNEGNISWYDLACEIYRQGREMGIIGKDCIVRPCTSAEYPSRVKRPAYSVMDKSKIKKTMQIKIPDWNASLRGYLALLAEKK